MTLLRLCLLILLTAVTPLAAEDPVEQQVEELLSTLKSGSRSEQRTAVQSLTKLGPPALAYLPDAGELDSARLRQAIEVVRTELERQASDQAARPSTVTLKGKFPPVEIADQLRLQTGNVIRIDPDAKLTKTVEVDWNATPFWSAITALESQRVGRFMPMPNESGLVWTQPVTTTASSRERELGLQVVGPFRIRVRSASSKPFGPRQQLLRMRLVLENEPRLRGLFLFVPMRDVSLTADGQRFATFTPTASLELPIPGGLSAEFDVLFPLPANFDPESSSLECKLPIVLSAGFRDITFRDLSFDPERPSELGIERLAGRTTVRLQRVEPIRSAKPGANATTGRVTISVLYSEGGPAFESHRNASLHGDAWLVHRHSDGDRRLRNTSFETEFETDGGMTIAYRVPLPAVERPRLDFVYRVPTLIMRRTLATRITIDTTKLNSDRDTAP